MKKIVRKRVKKGKKSEIFQEFLKRLKIGNLKNFYSLTLKDRKEIGERTRERDFVRRASIFILIEKSLICGAGQSDLSLKNSYVFPIKVFIRPALCTLKDHSCL
jgi:hypothetical protein